MGARALRVLFVEDLRRIWETTWTGLGKKLVRIFGWKAFGGGFGRAHVLHVLRIVVGNIGSAVGGDPENMALFVGRLGGWTPERARVLYALPIRRTAG